MKQITQVFPASTIGEVSQTGAELGARRRGVTVVLSFRPSETTPCCAEVFDTVSNGADYYAEIGLIFDGQTLVDYDGVFTLPSEVEQMLTQHGFTINL